MLPSSLMRGCDPNRNASPLYHLSLARLRPSPCLLPLPEVEGPAPARASATQPRFPSPTEGTALPEPRQEARSRRWSIHGASQKPRPISAVENPLQSGAAPADLGHQSGCAWCPRHRRLRRCPFLPLPPPSPPAPPPQFRTFSFSTSCRRIRMAAREIRKKDRVGAGIQGADAASLQNVGPHLSHSLDKGPPPKLIQQPANSRVMGFPFVSVPRVLYWNRSQPHAGAYIPTDRDTPRGVIVEGRRGGGELRDCGLPRCSEPTTSPPPPLQLAQLATLPKKHR